jgi:hypothetical protein
MGSIIIIRPRDDAASQQASDWADDLVKKLIKNGHTIAADVNDQTPPNKGKIASAINKAADVIFYFGHGDEDSWLTNWKSTLDASNVSSANGKTVISVACKTACKIGPNAITAGVKSWLGFTINVAVISPHKNADPIGDAIVKGLALLGSKATVQRARDEIALLLAQVKDDYDANGKYHKHPEARLGYYAAMALSDHVVVHGNVNLQPLP